VWRITVLLGTDLDVIDPPVDAAAEADLVALGSESRNPGSTR